MTESEKWAVKIIEFVERGKCHRVWCRETGIKRSTLRYWLERLDELSEGKEIRFAKVVIGGEHDDSTSTV